MDCIFCKIAKGEIPTEMIWENEQLMVFKDINPKAKIHLLIVSKKHIPTINDITEEDGDIIKNLILTARDIAIKQNFAERGYKLVFNVGSGGGQEIFHIHLHVLNNN